MKSPAFFISCDWGTTNFRLRLVETETLRAIAEYQNDQGVKKLYDQYAVQRSLNQEQFFSNYLMEQIRLLPEDHQKDLIVISGMASSNIALSELEYADMPFDFHGGSLYWKRILLPNGLKIVLISGVKGDNGMMRGEETQAIGLAENLRNFESGIMLLPGTHSKHLSYEHQQFTTLRNNMTGELFDIISQNSILSNSVVKGPWCESTAQAFLEGLDWGLSGKLTANLLYIRFNDVI
ncbi:MAG: 2-dehydro-3-deoxygalactonokinase, partial [Cyclobacteriaceae bacterium]|nr:2-dehydro-3-deoxygalactonokinase [Cyclobacteriaceae bacterium]